MIHRYVVLYAPAPIPHGDEVEVEILEFPSGRKMARLRHVATGVSYGPPGAFDDAAPPPHQIIGAELGYVSPRRTKNAKLIEQFTARVRECAVTNTWQKGEPGESVATTSFLLEVATASAYR